MLRNSISLNIAGLRGKEVVAGITDDGSRIAIGGKWGGRIEFPISSITHIRLACRPGGPRMFFKCTIRRENGWPVAVNGAESGSDYAGFVRHLAREMERIERFDRIERGLPLWHAMVLLLVCQVALLFPGFLTWLWWEYSWKFEPRHYLYVIGLALPWIGAYVWCLWIWRRRYWPRPARDMNDLTPMLPSERKRPKVLGIPLY